MANKTIKNLSVIGYNAEFEYAGATGTIEAIETELAAI